ncbi:Frag1/DRAM/Sfk1 family protein [Rhodospirillales bacterium]|nr:Frag1/DRAM/Sfk1 family protein [Rhodospirillales bacterium]
MIERLPLSRHVINISFFGVFVLGMLAIVVSRLVFNVDHSDWYIDTIPSISKTAAFEPSGTYFSILMGGSGLCIIIVWSYTYLFNWEKLSELPTDGKRFSKWNKLTLFLGIGEGVSVALMATVSLETHNDAHIAFSIGTFLFGSLAFLSESFLLGRWRYISKEKRHYSFRIRQINAISIALISLFFLYLFLERTNGPIVDFYTTQIIYIASEHVIATCSFAYAPLLFLEVRKHFMKNDWKLKYND